MNGPAYLTHDLTPEIVESIVAMVGEAEWPHIAAGKLNVPKDVFQTWMSQGEEDKHHGQDTLERELVERVYFADCDAAAAARADLMDRIKDTKYFQGRLAFMCRRWPSMWGNPEIVDRTPSTVEDEMRKLAAEMERRAAETA